MLNILKSYVFYLHLNYDIYLLLLGWCGKGMAGQNLCGWLGEKLKPK